MKAISIVLFALLAISFVSAGYPYPSVSLSQKVINRWADNNGQLPYVQVEVTLKNVGHSNVNTVVIDTDHTLNLKDGNAIWNISILGNGDLSLPAYGAPLSPGETFTFGYINKGNNAANLRIRYAY
eukprot:gene9199-11274_t